MASLLSILVGLALSAGPGGMPDKPSLTLDGFALSATTDLGAIGARIAALQDEKTAARPSLEADLTVHRRRCPYLGLTPFDPDANLALTRRLRERFQRLKAVIVGDPEPAALASKVLDQAITRRWACAQDCDALDLAVSRARANLQQTQALDRGRVRAARLESALIALQRHYLRRVRDNLRVRERRRQAPGPVRRQFERRAINVTPRAVLEAIEARKLAAAEAARQRTQRLTDIHGTCEQRDERRTFEKTYQDQLKLEQGRLAGLDETQEQLANRHAAYIEKIDGLIHAVESGDERVRTPFDHLHTTLLARVDQAIEGRTTARHALEVAAAALLEAESERRKAAAAVPVLEPGWPDQSDPCEADQRDLPGALAVARHQSAKAALAVEVARVSLHKAQRQSAELELRATNNALRDSRGLLRRVLPYLSVDYAAQEFRYDARFVQRLTSNLALLVGDAFSLLKTRGVQLQALPGRLLSWHGLTRALAALFWLFVILWAGRFVYVRIDAWLVRIWAWLKSQRALHPILELARATLKLISAAARPALVWLTIWVGCDYLGRAHLEVTAFYVVAEWILLYRVLRNLSCTLFIGPTWPAARRGALTRAFDAEPLVARDLDSAAVSERSLHLVIIYFIWRTAALTTVELLLGQDYLFHLTLDLVSLVQWLLVILLIVWWRGRVAAGYLRSGPDVGRSFVERHHHRPWFAVLVLPMAAVVVSRRIGPWFRELSSAAGPLRGLTRFLSRRALEQAARAAHGEPERLPDRPRIPEYYGAAFGLRPLDAEDYVIAPRKPVQAIVGVFDFWSKARREGSVAIVGESGMGKTTLINQVLRALPPVEGRVLRGRPDRKLNTEAEIITFLSEVFGFEQRPSTLAALEQAILDDTNPICVIDDAHQFFLKTMGGMEGLDAFLHVVEVTCTNVFWITAFDAYPWFFIKNLKRTEPPFRHIVRLRPWSVPDIEGLILSRSTSTGYRATFQDLVVDRGTGDRAQYEVVKTARSYFRLLGDMAGGNPAVALRYWLSSLHPDPVERIVRVGLFTPSTPQALTDASDDMLFVLTCVASHNSLTPRQIADVLQMPLDAVTRLLSYSEENELIYRKSSGVVALDLDNYPEIVRMLVNRGFIYF